MKHLNVHVKKSDVIVPSLRINERNRVSQGHRIKWKFSVFKQLSQCFVVVVSAQNRENKN